MKIKTVIALLFAAFCARAQFDPATFPQLHASSPWLANNFFLQATDAISARDALGAIGSGQPLPNPVFTNEVNGDFTIFGSFPTASGTQSGFYTFAGGNTNALDLRFGQLFGHNIATVDFISQNLSSANGTTLDWGNSRLIQTGGIGTIVLDWQNLALTGGWTLNSSNLVTRDAIGNIIGNLVGNADTATSATTAGTATTANTAGNLTTISTNSINTNNASTLSSGTVPLAQIPTLDSNKVSSAGTATTAVAAGGATNLASGIPEARIFANNKVMLPNGIYTNFPNSTTAGYIEVQALLNSPAWTSSNTYHSGFSVVFEPGTFHLQSQINISNALDIGGAPYGITVFVYDNTNGFNVQAATNAMEWVDSSGFPTGRVSCAVIQIPDVTSDAGGLWGPPVKIHDIAFTCASNMAGWFIYSKAQTARIENCWFGRDGFLNTGESGWHIGIDGVGGGTNAPLMNGIYLGGQNKQTVHGCFFWGLANGIICKSTGGYYVVDDYYDLGIGLYDPTAQQGGPFTWSNPDSNGNWTGYPHTSKLSIGAGIMALSGYRIDLNNISTLFDNWGIVCGSSSGAGVTIKSWTDQGSQNQGGAEGAVLADSLTYFEGNKNYFIHSIVGSTYAVTPGIANNFATVNGMDNSNPSSIVFSRNGTTIFTISTNKIESAASSPFTGNAVGLTNYQAYASMTKNSTETFSYTGTGAFIAATNFTRIRTNLFVGLASQGTLTNLNAGTYKFQILASLNDNGNLGTWTGAFFTNGVQAGDDFVDSSPQAVGSTLDVHLNSSQTFTIPALTRCEFKVKDSNTATYDFEAISFDIEKR